MPGGNFTCFPYDAFAGALSQIGFSAHIAGLFAEMSRAINEGRVRSLEGRNKGNTTRTTFDVFADTLAAAYKAQ